jgi:hypothetical protein
MWIGSASIAAGRGTRPPSEAEHRDLPRGRLPTRELALDILGVCTSMSAMAALLRHLPRKNIPHHVLAAKILNSSPYKQQLGNYLHASKYYTILYSNIIIYQII